LVRGKPQGKDDAARSQRKTGATVAQVVASVKSEWADMRSVVMPAQWVFERSGGAAPSATPRASCAGLRTASRAAQTVARPAPSCNGDLAHK